MTDLFFSSLTPPPPPPPSSTKTLRNSLKSSTHGQSIRYMWNDEYNILWNHISDLFYEDLEYGMHLLPNITLEHINLTSHSKMNVRLAAKFLVPQSVMS